MKKHTQDRKYASIARKITNKTRGKFWKFSNSINDKQEKEAELLLYGVIGEDGLWSDVKAKQVSDE